MKTWKDHTGMKIRIGDSRANMALKILNRRIIESDAFIEGAVKSGRYSDAAGLNAQATGLQIAFNVLYNEFALKKAPIRRT